VVSHYGADDFLRDYGDDYITLNKMVLDVCFGIQSRLGKHVVTEVYCRPTSGAGGPFKSAEKIATKVRKWGLTPTESNFLLINDIIGITVVIAYPDYIDQVVAAVKKALQTRKSTLIDIVKHEARNGYYATHLNYSHFVKAEKLKFELQIKTLLHNAWSKKMHDLTYKPTRANDPRLDALMASVATTIQSLEDQSKLIRDMIQANWNIELLARQEARRQVFDDMLRYSEASWNTRPREVLDLRTQVDAAIPWLPKEPAGSAKLRKLTEAVDKCCAKPELLRYGWILAGQIASHRPESDLNRFFRRHAGAWLEEAKALFAQNKIDSKEVRTIPLVFYVLGDLESAISYSLWISQEKSFESMSEQDRVNLEFNRIDFLIEREFHQPTQQADQRREIRKQVEEFLSSLKPEQHPAPDFESAVADARGMMMITFGTNATEVREGIEICVKARTLATEDIKVSDAYADLHMRLGWRRYFELEIVEQANPAGARQPK